MKRAASVPFAGDWESMEAFCDFLHSSGWHLTLWQEESRWLLRAGPRILSVRIAPSAGQIFKAEITVSSGATLVHDDTDSTMALALEPGRRDAPPPQAGDEIPVLYEPGDTIHMHGQPPAVLGEVVALLPERRDGEPVYEIVVYGGDFDRREFPRSHTVPQSYIDPADTPPRRRRGK